MLRPTPGDPWGVEQHHWNTGEEGNQQLNPGEPSNRQKSSGPNQQKPLVLVKRWSDGSVYICLIGNNLWMYLEFSRHVIRLDAVFRQG